MALTYDFDIFDPSGQRTASAAGLDGFMAQAGFSGSSAEGVVALFRDPKTADALRRAPMPLRDYFLRSGFGTNTYHSGAPAGRYPAQDEEARLAIIERLTENAVHFHLPPSDLKDASEETFNLADFLHHLTEATPIEPALALARSKPVIDAISAPVAKEAHTEQEPVRSRVPGLLGLGHRLLRSVARPRIAER